MPLQNYQYDTIMRQYSKTQSRNRNILQKRIEEVYAKIPRLKEIDDEVATLSARKARALLNGQENSTEDLKEEISLLAQERSALLVCNSYPEDYLELLTQSRKESNARLFAGFGIGTPERARELLQHGFDGVIIGTAIMKQLNQSEEDLYQFVGKLAETVEEVK